MPRLQVPKNVFQELRGRFGNMYFINEEGTEEAIKRVTGILYDCLEAGGCTFVPGLSEQQRLFSLVPITSGAFLSGGALRGGFNNRWSYIFLLLWAPWIIGFGYYPLYIRQPDDLSPLIENTVIFATIFALTRWSPLLNGAAGKNSFSFLGGSAEGPDVAETKGKTSRASSADEGSLVSSPSSANASQDKAKRDRQANEDR